MKLIKRVFNRTISGRRINNLQLLSFYSISSSDYDKISNETLESLYESLEILGDQVDIPGYDVELAVRRIYYHFPISHFSLFDF